MTRRILIILGIVIAFAITVPVGILYYLAYTPQGLQFVVAHLPARIGGTELHFAGARGTLARGFTLQRFELEHERVHLKFTGVQGRVTLLPLLLQTVHAADVTIKDAYVEVRRWKKPPPRSSPRFLPRGLIIRVDRAHVSAGTFIAQNGRRFDLTDVTTSGVARYRTLRFFEASFTQNALHVTGSSTLRAADPMQIDGDVRIDIRSPGQPPWIIAASGHGDLDKLGVTARFTEPVLAELTGSVEDLTSGWHWSGTGKLQNLDLRTWGGGGALGQISAVLALHGDADGFGAKGSVTPAGLNVGSFETIFEGSYADRTITATRIDLTHGSGAHATGAGTIEIVSPNGPRLDLHGTWQNFRWPLVGNNIAVRSESGEYALSGVRPYHLKAAGALVPSGVEPMHVEMEGTLAADRLTVSSANVEAFEGQTLVSGEVVWSPERRWSAMGDAADINPARVRADLPGKLDFGFTASGLGFGNDNFEVEIRGLHGRLRGTPASGAGRIARNKNAWRFSQTRLVLGGTTIAADGSVADALNLRFAVDSEDLSLLQPDSRGKLHAQGTLRGTLQDPVIEADVRGGGLLHRGVSLESIGGTIDFDATGSHPSKIELRARKLGYGDRTIDDLAVTLNGNATDHAARISVKARGLEAESELHGSFAHGVWLGQVRKLSVSGMEALHLELDTPVDLLLSAKRTRLDWLCLNG
ncbi:MAG TPA: hypothetical protein VG994_05490, partial [Steroidobacteraceae bacterium]|nr:hypothetical protein [Steroidobacteraceae bacterium]